jgi:oligopeptidase B
MYRYCLWVLIIIILNGCGSRPEVSMEKNAKDLFPRLVELDRPEPVARQIPFKVSYHGQELSDPYHWLKDQSYPEVDDKEVLDYLDEENKYFHEFLDPNRDLVETIFQEFKGRSEETEESVPFVKNGYEYRWFYRPGDEYRTYSRKSIDNGETQIILDQAALAKGFDYFDIGDWRVSPDNNLLAYTYDTDGDERYELRIIDLQTGKYLLDQLEDVAGELEFGADGSTIIYSLLEPDRWHSKNINIHKLGQNQSEDKTIFYEEDDEYFLGFYLTSDDQYLVLESTQRETQDAFVVSMDDVYSEPVKLAGREDGFTLSIDHSGNHFYILANDVHKNFRLASVNHDRPDQENWKTIEIGTDDNYLMDFQTFKDFMVIKSRKQGIDNISIRSYDDQVHNVIFPEKVSTLYIGQNTEFQQSFVRLGVQSMITPPMVVDYQIKQKKIIERKVKKIPSGYDKALYRTERLMAKARDGKLVPVSIVYKKGIQRDGTSPMLLYGYGAYGITVSPTFSTMRLSLLDRGFVYAIAHIRGGSMLGYQWYLDGKLEQRENTFNDFVDVANFLVDEKYTSAGNISIVGRSAGGELMGAAVIQAPHLWRSVNLGVPFVDVLNSMLDESLPLTPPEWKEWGNPIKDPQAFDFLKSYSPYDNITNREYPPMLVSGGLNDPRVTYWEPAKWTAKMRNKKTDNNLLVMRINMGAGHFANTGRFGRLKDYAEEYVFTLLAHNIKQ